MQSKSERAILVKLGRKGEATKYDLSREGGPNYSVVWKTIEKLKKKGFIQETRKEESQKSPLKKTFYRLTFQGLLTTMSLEEARRELKEIAEANMNLWSLPHELFTCLGEEWEEVVRNALSYWCGLAFSEREERRWKEGELENNLLNFLCVLASLQGKEEEFAEKLKKHPKLRKAYIEFLSEEVKKQGLHQRLLRMLKEEEEK